MMNFRYLLNGVKKSQILENLLIYYLVSAEQTENT